MKHDIAIVGAGVVGLSTAWRLARQGARVLVLDASEFGGRGSRAAAGVAIPSVRLVGDTAMMDLTRGAREVLAADLAALPDSGALRRGEGILRLAPDAATRQQLQERASAEPAWLGRWIDKAELEQLEPALAGTPALGAFVSEHGFMVDTHAYLNALIHAITSLGGTVRFNEPVLAIEEGPSSVKLTTGREKLDADRVALCAGAWCGNIPGLAPLPVAPMRGQMLTLLHPRFRLRHVVSGPTYLAPWRSGEIVVGATEEEAGFADHPTMMGMIQLLAAAAKTAPPLRDAQFLSAWAGLRSVTPDGRPLIGLHPGSRRTFVGTGHGGQGILTGGITGTALAELLQTDKSDIATPFSPARAFSSGPVS